MSKRKGSGKGRKPARLRDQGGAKGTPPVVFSDGTKAGDVLEWNWEEDENGVPQVVGRLVRTTIGGAIWQGKCKNPKAGPGRPPEKIREQARDAYADRIARLQQIIDDPTTPARDVIGAMAQLARVGVASQVEHQGDRGQPIVILPPQSQPRVLEAEVIEAEAEVQAEIKALPESVKPEG